MPRSGTESMKLNGFGRYGNQQIHSPRDFTHGHSISYPKELKHNRFLSTYKKDNGSFNGTEKQFRNASLEKPSLSQKMNFINQQNNSNKKLPSVSFSSNVSRNKITNLTMTFNKSNGKFLEPPAVLKTESINNEYGQLENVN